MFIPFLAAAAVATAFAQVGAMSVRIPSDPTTCRQLSPAGNRCIAWVCVDCIGCFVKFFSGCPYIDFLLAIFPRLSIVVFTAIGFDSSCFDRIA